MRKFIIGLISFLLLVIPFLWFKPGELDLGGDSSRLYFFDPINFLLSHSLYSIFPSGLGGQSASFWGIPFIFFIFLLQTIFKSPHIVTYLFDGISLSLSFLSVYLTVYYLLKDTKNKRLFLLDLAGILAGLFYIFTPVLTNGWDKVILTHNQIFLNPLIFFLLFRYVQTTKFYYIISVLLVSFIFSPNFSAAAAPPIFAFYPLSIFFLMCYRIFILHKKIIFKHILVGFILFIILHSFHLLPQISFILSPGTATNTAIFTAQGKFDRGLSYFTGISPSIKLVNSFLGVEQLTAFRQIYYFYIIFPMLLVLGLYYIRGIESNIAKKSILLTVYFFLIAVFFYTANVTNVGFNFYKNLFNIPGFAMFRNYYGQWEFLYIFFYAILLGQLLYFLFSLLKARFIIPVTGSLVVILIISAMPFINGSIVNKNLWQTNVKIGFTFDSKYIDTLNYIRNFSHEGKILTLPLADPGYQVLVGSNGGGYQGPSTIAYLTSHKDFTGYEDFDVFKDIFLNAIKQKDFITVKSILSLLNIHYVFYNSDPRVYGEYFPQFPYANVKNYLPTTQNGYKNFIQQLGVEEIKTFGNNYHIYRINNATYLPHLYAPENILYTDESIDNFSFYLPQKNRIAILPIAALSTTHENGALLVSATSSDPYALINDNYHLHKHYPFVSIPFNSLLYPFTLLKQQFTLHKLRNDQIAYLDNNFLFESKILFGLDKWGQDVPVLHQEITSSFLSNWFNISRYNSWDALFFLYESDMNKLIARINQNKNDYFYNVNKIKISEQIQQNENFLINIINAKDFSAEDRKYLLHNVYGIFSRLESNLQLATIDPFKKEMKVVIPKGQSGKYNIYIKDPLATNNDAKIVKITINNNVNLIPSGIDKNGYLILPQVDLHDIVDNTLTLYIEPINLGADDNWRNTDDSINTTSDHVQLNFNNDASSNGFTQRIQKWKPNKQYLISFDYRTFNTNVTYDLIERTKVPNSALIDSVDFFTKNLQSNDWKHIQTYVSSDTNSINAFVRFTNTHGQGNTKLTIRNFSVYQMYSPTVLAEKVNQKENVMEIPVINITKINPTKYMIHINQKTTRPFFLVLSDQFNNQWKLFDRNSLPKGNITGFIYTIIHALLTPFIKQEQMSTVDSYYNNSITFSPDNNDFLTQDSFESKFEKQISKNAHYEANDYANAWLVNPSDLTQKDGSFTLIAEMNSESNFLIYFFVSCITFFILLGSFIYLVRKK